MPSNTLFAVLGWLAVSPAVPSAEAYRILGIFPVQSRSHNIMFKATMQALVDSGHEVVDLSPFPLKTPRANYTDVDISAELPSMVNSMTFNDMSDLSRKGLFDMIRDRGGANLCRKVFEMKQFQDIIRGAYGKFDVVFTEICCSDCWTVVAHKLQWWLQYPSDEVLRELFGEDTPPISELVRNTSLVMVNGHVSVNPARPVNPNVIEVLGIHLRDKPSVNNIPSAIRQWMDDAEHGVVYFSLGSQVRSDSLPKATIEALLAAFAALPQRVLWKYEDAILQPPPNVKIAPWLPQSDVLAHPKVLVFMTHGGLMGTTEALSLGVPMIGIPIFADQGPNILQYAELGIARELSHRHISKDTVLATIREFTTSNNNALRYRERAKEIAARFADRPRSAAREAVWWTEYVVRNQGARHLRPLGADLPLHQYLLLDVVGVFLAAAAAVLLVFVAALKKVLRLVSPKQPPRQKRKTQ
ncbi:UDP-glucuronosyltransferase 2B15-like isoform X3 [Thrips palmi]|uniref:UDP-glucuronosyltransferase n=1 Tax=Thrips palmi TaxID=161013 RepID=A0A6P8ZNB9_THRPL|nr:UDP-glucuronosyltransferase 2B15-like isoform X3 [Thrips palmi]